MAWQRLDCKPDKINFSVQYLTNNCGEKNYKVWYLTNDLRRKFWRHNHVPCIRSLQSYPSYTHPLLLPPKLRTVLNFTASRNNILRRVPLFVLLFCPFGSYTCQRDKWKCDLGHCAPVLQTTFCGKLIPCCWCHRQEFGLSCSPFRSPLSRSFLQPEDVWGQQC